MWVAMAKVFQIESLESRRLLSAGIDPTFGTNGVISGEINYLPGGVPIAVMVRPDKRVVVAANYSTGSQNQAGNAGEALVGLLPDGSLDPSFGVNGIVDLAKTPFESLAQAVLQPDGKILVVGDGAGSGGSSDIVLARLNSDGTADTSFADNGFATSNLQDGFVPQVVQSEGVALQPDGSIIVASASNKATDASLDFLAEVLRFTPAGQLDSKFAQGGALALLNAPVVLDAITGVAIDSEDRIIVGGDEGLLRITPAGELDPHFGTGGYADAPGGDAYGALTSIAIQHGGQIIVAGSASGSTAMYAAQFTENGTLDRSCGKKGITIVSLPDRSSTDRSLANGVVNALALDRHGRIVLAGYESQSNVSVGTGEAQGADFAVVRLTASGALDSSFAKNGRQEISGGNLWPDVSNTADAVAISRDGSIVVAGFSTNADGTIPGEGLVLARDRSDGSLDKSFGYEGRAGIVPVLPKTQVVVAQTDRKLVLAGVHALARLTTDGTLDPSFGVQGKVLSSSDIADDLREGSQPYLDTMNVVSGGRIIEVISQQSSTAAPFELRAFTSAGAVDGGFPSGIAAARRLAHRFYGFFVLSALVQNDGSILLLATGALPMVDLVVRLTPRGTLDPAFGSKGVVVVNVRGTPTASFSQLFTDSAGDAILLGGGDVTSGAFPMFSLIAVKFDAKGHLDPTFGATPFALPSTISSQNFFPQTVQAADGSIYASFPPANGLSIVHLVNGNVDASGLTTLDAPAELSGNGDTFGVLGNRIFKILFDDSGTPMLTAFHTDGTLDTTFADNGSLTLPISLSPQFISGQNGTLILADLFDSIIVRVNTSA